jgi:hypothetical protein
MLTRADNGWHGTEHHVRFRAINRSERTGLLLAAA